MHTDLKTFGERLLDIAAGKPVQYRLNAGIDYWEDIPVDRQLYAHEIHDLYARELRLKPEPTLAEQWEGMEEVEGYTHIRSKGGQQFVCEFRSSQQADWLPTSPSWLPLTEYRIRKLTLAERNAEVKKRWEGMEMVTHSRRRGAGRLFCMNRRNLPNGEWYEVPAPLFDEGSMLCGEYRIVELPPRKLVPWSLEKHPGGSVFVQKKSESGFLLGLPDWQYLIVGWGPINVVAGLNAVAYSDLLSHYDYLPAPGKLPLIVLPCGVETE